MATRYWTGGAADNNFGTAGNWSDSTAPGSWGSSDVVWITDSADDITAGLAQSAVAIAELHVTQSYTGNLGTTSAYLAIAATDVYIGEHFGTGSPAGSGRIKINTGSTASTYHIFNSSSNATETNLPPIRILGNSASAVANVFRGSVGVGADAPGETGQFATVDVSFVNNAPNDAEVIVGAGITLATFDARGGANLIDNSPTTVNVDAGTTRLAGDGTVTNLKVRGRCDIIGELTVTNTEVYSGFQLNADRERVTFTNGIDFVRCGPQDGRLNLGNHLTLTPAAI